MNPRKIKNDLRKFLEKNLSKAILLRSHNQKLVQGHYVYPTQVKSLRNKIVGENNVIKVDDYLIDRDIDFIIKKAKFKKIIHNGFFNPYENYDLLNYYVKPSTYRHMDKIFIFKNNEDAKRNFVHIGEKGSGKTAKQNVWLAENNDKLEQENIFWVRCDGHKLYRLWEDWCIKEKTSQGASPDMLSLASIDDYLNIQLLYVFAKYCIASERKFFNKIFKQIQKHDEDVDFPISRRVFNDKKKRSLHECIMEVHDTIVREEKNEAPSYSYAVDHVLRVSADTYQFEKRKWVSVSKSLQKFFLKHSIFVLTIVDGVDNIHINNRSASAKYYEKMLYECAKYMLEDAGDKKIKFIALRERTYYDVLELNPHRLDTVMYSDRYELYHQAAALKDVIHKRNDYSLKHIFDKGDLSFRIFKAIANQADSSFNWYYHNNIRECLHNKLSLTSSLYYRLLQINKTAGDNLESHIKNLKKRNLFLNGRLFIDSQKQWHDLNNELGVCCMNIFFFDSKRYACNSPENWLGLCRVRILQLLQFNHAILEKNLIALLVECFEYPQEFVMACVRDLRAFGMIDSKYYGGRISLVISDKGSFILTETFSNIDFLYYFAIDSALPQAFTKQHMIEVHSNKINARTGYPSASVISSISFVLFLLAVSSKERQRYKKNKARLVAGLADIDVGELRLPIENSTIFAGFLESMEAMIDSADDRDQEQLEHYVSHMKSLSLKQIDSSLAH